MSVAAWSSDLRRRFLSTLNRDVRAPKNPSLSPNRSLPYSCASVSLKVSGLPNVKSGVCFLLLRSIREKCLSSYDHSPEVIVIDPHPFLHSPSKRAKTVPSAFKPVRRTVVESPHSQRSS